ncbi:reverse transcriptase domain-containing protein [Effusibacillus consociatus]
MVIERIFEADFQDFSYGFRPGRSQHQALRHIRRAVKKGIYWVVDIDIQGYFDNICHDKLMKLIEQLSKETQQVRSGRNGCLTHRTEETCLLESTVMHREEEHRKAG